MKPRRKPAAKALLPEVVAVSQMLAVHWIWFTLALAACCGQLSPRDRMELCPSILVPSTLWICLCHPGATNSSGVIRVVSQAMEKLYQRMFEVETEAMKDQNTKPLLRKGLAGGGSLAAAGHAASQPQNRGSFLAAEPEIDGVLGWFSAELAIDKGVPGKLWDALIWDRPVMSSQKAFTIPDPWFGFLCGGHIPDLFNHLQQALPETDSFTSHSW